MSSDRRSVTVADLKTTFLAHCLDSHRLNSPLSYSQQSFPELRLARRPLTRRLTTYCRKKMKKIIIIIIKKKRA